MCCVNHKYSDEKMVEVFSKSSSNIKLSKSEIVFESDEAKYIDSGIIVG